MRIRSSKKGFTLPEMVVTMIVLAVILAIGIPTAINYIKRAEFRKNEENAKTIYMVAESVLTWYRSSGQWEEFREEVLDKGILNTSFEDEKKDRIYAITLAPGAYGTEEGKSSPVLTLIDKLTYSKDLLSSGAIGIEIDVESGHVYSAFYGTRCRGLDYGTGDADKILDMDDRAYESRRERFLGYYSVEDITNVVDLEPVRLKISSISLVNSETLYLNWSSNSRHDNLDLKFHISFYEKESNKELFRVDVDMAEARKKGWNGSISEPASITALPMIVNGTEVEGWSFPLIYQDGAFSLVLDGMMSADALAALENTRVSESERNKMHQSVDVSITRLAGISGIKDASGVDLRIPHDIYATVQAESTYQNTGGDTSEYRQSSIVSSNKANTMYADGTKMDGNTLKAGISAFRHLSNIRYYDGQSPAEFVLNSREMDWNSVGTGLYGYTELGGGKWLKWQANDGKLEFPAIGKLAKEHSLTGDSVHSKISNLRLGLDSVADDKTAESLGISPAEYMGLICVAEGNISNITFHNPTLVMADLTGGMLKDAPDFAGILGVGIVAGKSTGELSDIEITADSSEKEVLTVSLADERKPGMAERIAGVGGIAGVIEKNKIISRLSVSGSITAKLPVLEAVLSGTETIEDVAKEYHYGIGGLFGYADVTDATKIVDCENHAALSGNAFAGGIAGHIDGSFKAGNYDSATEEALEAQSDIQDCENDGLILCSVSHKASENEMEGRYFGGIIGYAHQVLFYQTSSASGRSSDFIYSEARKNLLKGQYVGGILGFGSDCLLLSCRTENKGYILGSDYVGGIVGGMTEHDDKFSRIGGGISVTVNAGYVIGENYVGGIVGKNDGSNKIENCVNNGVAAGYSKYIGGIVGYNGERAVISNSVSYVSDHSGGIFRQIVDTWRATGSYVGGIAGYNNGKIEFKDSDNKITVKSVSGIVVGQDYVGGVVGFNDTNGMLDVEYELIGGRIYAYGDCAGGYIGLNASTKILEDDSIAIRPSSIRGIYCVGGCIGANVVELTEDTMMAGYHTNNTLGNLTAKAFAGGIIGYQRTYRSDQLGMSQGESMLSYIEEKNGKNSLLPQLDEDYLPTEVTASSNIYELVLTDKNNSGDSLNSAINNVKIYAQMYVGGVLGYCEDSSKLVVRNCKNTGHIQRASSTEFETAANGVSVVDYLKYSKCPQDEINQVDAGIKTDMAGGITGANLTNQVIDHCANTGGLTGFTCLGGVVGFNGGGVFNCELAGNFGNASQDYVGGIAGLNIQTSSKKLLYTDVRGKTWNNYGSGTIAVCRVNSGVTVTGRSTVGGIAAYNLPGGVVQDSVCAGNVTAYADYAGGIAGQNGGTILATEDENTNKRTISGRNGQGIGGLVGRNQETGSIRMSGAGETTALGPGVIIIGGQNVGGLIGENEGSFGTEGDMLVCKADTVRALRGNAGGIAGISSKDIQYAMNASKQVTADTGAAGGIVSSNQTGVTIAFCMNTGNVNSNYGNAGGIAAENHGMIQGCSVYGNGETITIRSRKAAQAGAVCAVNYEGAVIQNSAPGVDVLLNGDSIIYGAIAGLNQGIVRDTFILSMPEVEANGASNLSVGGAAGVNEKEIINITAWEPFESFKNYRYLGGVAGENVAGAKISGSSYAGTMTEAGASTPGNCYGGIAGINSGTVTECSVKALTMNVRGIYTATSTSSAEQKEALSSHVGGIAGKNEATGEITLSYLDASGGSITVASGMAGGVAGYNKGLISRSGDKTTVDKMKDYTGEESIDELCSSMNITAETGYVNWQDNAQIENLKYNGSNTTVSAGKTTLIMSTKGNLGGITAYNSPTGALEYCATGGWFLNNKSNDIGVGTGGIIGMNESEKDMQYLVNQAFVGRQLNAVNTNRFAGGIIGNQNNSTTDGWTLSHCVNYGMVYGYKSHYSGGIIGQWTGSGGNIEECRNYGSLQTTYATDWVGASAGIVAQLYHAYEGNTYNIISCGNFGSIYGRYGKNTADAANDSGGILGNVTAYLKSAAEAQDFTIQVLDCINGPGVEIYSGSMASGIVGFFSSDNPNAGNITDSTANIKLRIERCSNFAAILKGVQYSAGIFGDRYGDKGAKNTTIVDCYSVNDKSRRDFPIVSFNNSSASKPYSVTQAWKNFFFDDIDSRKSYPETFSLAEGRDNTTDNAGTIQQNSYTVTDWLKRVGGDRVYIMHNRTGNYDFVASLTNEAKNLASISAKQCYINPDDGTIYQKGNNEQNDTKIGKILFELPNSGEYTATANLTNPASIFYTYVRESWRVQEGVMRNTKKLTAPKSVTAEIFDGKINLEITPADNPDPWAEKGSKCDPFKYQIDIYLGRTLASTEYLYTESGSVSLPEGPGGDIRVEVRAVSMYKDVESSNPTSATQLNPKVLLPAPDIRAELVWTNNGYRYEISLNNLEDYNNLAGNNWYVDVKVSGQNVTLSPDNPTEKVQGNANQQQIIAQAKPSDTTDYVESAQVSVAAYMPAYMADVPLVSWDPNNSNEPVARPGVEVTGNTLDKLNVTVSLTYSGRTINTPTVYRVDLLGTWKEGTPEAKENVVFASEDLLVAAQGTVSVSFSGLPEYLGDASNLRIRIWYAETGLGPVYTYHKLDTDEGSNNTQMTGVDDTGNPVYEYLYSETLVHRRYGGDRDLNDYFKRYRYLSDSEIFTWLPAPVLAGVTDGDGGALTPEYDSDGNLQYTFYWDADTAYQADAKYEISLMGVDESDNTVLIDTSSLSPERGTYEEKTAWALTVPAEDWNFKEVRLSVTRIGNEAAHQIGLTSDASYRVRQRLPRPEQPGISINSVDELDYTVTWPAITPETGCGAYQLYARIYDEVKQDYGTPFALGEPVAVSGEPQYSMTINLEDYAGEQLRFYLVAKADAASTDYVDSAAGITTDLTVPGRIGKPSVTWSASWRYDRGMPLSVNGFLAGGLTDGLTVTLTADNAASIPPGGSAYLMRAYIYESEEEAKTAMQDAETAGRQNLTGYLTGYVAVDEDIHPVEMEKAGSDTEYRHTLEGLAAAYAGKWAVFQARISSGNGSVSSQWVTKAEPARLPYVKLDKPEVRSAQVWNALTAKVSENPDLPPQESEWSAEQTVFYWNSGEYADVCYVNITEKTEDPAGLLHQYRIMETEVDGSPALAIYEWEADGAGTEQWKEVTRSLPEQGTMTDSEYEALKKQQFIYPLTGYQKTVEGSYTNNDVTSYYKLSTEAYLQAELQADGTFRYTLTLPDTSSVKDADGYALNNSAWGYSSKISFRMDVVANEAPDDAHKSPAYVGSEENVVELN